MKSYSCLLAIVCLTSFGSLLPAQVESSEDFKSKVLADWNALLERVNSMRGKMYLEYYHTGHHHALDGTRLRLQKKDTYRYGYSHDGFFFENISGKNDDNGKFQESDHELSLQNREYRAQLSRTKKNDGWLLSDLKMTGENKELNRGAPLKTLWRNWSLPWLVLWNGAVFVPEWFRDPSFVITRIEKINAGIGGKLSRVHFLYDGSSLQDPKLSDFILTGLTVSGFIDFDDNLSCRIMGYAVHYKYKQSEGDRKGELVYEEGGGIPILKIITEETPKDYSENGWASDKEIKSFEYSYDSPPSPEEFRLSHYDLPEPLGSAPLPKSHAYLWIALGAVAAAVIALSFSWMARRRRKAEITR